MPAPSYRKGAMAAALALEAGEDRSQPTPPPVEAVSLKDLAVKLGEKAMRVLETDLYDPDSRARQEAARSLAALCIKFLDQQEDKPPDPTPEERQSRLLASLRDPDPELAEVLERAGWRKA